MSFLTSQLRRASLGLVVALLLGCQEPGQRVVDQPSDVHDAEDLTSDGPSDDDLGRADVADSSLVNACQLGCGPEVADISDGFPDVFLGHACTGADRPFQVSVFDHGECLNGPVPAGSEFEGSEEYWFYFRGATHDFLDQAGDQPVWLEGSNDTRDIGAHVIDGAQEARAVRGELCLQRADELWQGSWCVELENGETRGGFFTGASLCEPEVCF